VIFFAFINGKSGLTLHAAWIGQIMNDPSDAIRFGYSNKSSSPHILQKPARFSG
jgi:hypothetical protein